MRNHSLVLFWLESGNFGLLVIVTTSLIQNFLPHGTGLRVSRVSIIYNASLSWPLGLCGMSLVLWHGLVPWRPLVTPVPLARLVVPSTHVVLCPPLVNEDQRAFNPQLLTPSRGPFLRQTHTTGPPPQPTQHRHRHLSAHFTTGAIVACLLFSSPTHVLLPPSSTSLGKFCSSAREPGVTEQHRS